MREIIFWRTKSYGGSDGSDIIVRNFETPEIAKQDALEDDWNSGFFLYEVTLTFNDGIITEKEKLLGQIPCYRSILLENILEDREKSKTRKKN